MPACIRDPEVETELRCSRCETWICPRCLVFTHAGARCLDCAQLRRPPMYELTTAHYLRAAAAALAVAAALGVAGAFLLPPTTATYTLRLVWGLLAGIGSGAVMAGALDRATGGKRGTPLQVAAVIGVGLAVALRLTVAGDLDPEIATRDTAGILAAVAAAVTAWGRLR